MIGTWSLVLAALNSSVIYTPIPHQLTFKLSCLIELFKHFCLYTCTILDHYFTNRSALSVDLENPEVERIKKDFEMYRLNRENDVTNMQKKVNTTEDTALIGWLTWA